MAPLCRFLQRFVSKDISQEVNVNGLFNLCKETIRKSAALYMNLENASEDVTYLMKRHQCEVLVNGLSATERTLARLQQLSFLDGKSIPVLQALHQVLMDAEGTIQSCSTCTSEFLRTAFEKGDMKETFQELLYDIRWHTDLLHSIFVDNSGESPSVTFAPAMCSGQLNPTDELALLVAMMKDEEVLQRRLSSVKLDNPIEQDIVTQLVNNVRFVEEGTDDQLLNSRESKEQSPMVGTDAATDLGMVPSSSFDLVFLNSEILRNYYKWQKLGRGAFGEVREGKLLGSTYAVKMFLVQDSKSFYQEMAAIQGLGHHPHVLRPFFFSRTEHQCFLIMEKMDMELVEYLESRKQPGNKVLSIIEAVGLMLQIAEGMRHIHQKRMAHRDLKPGNILVSLAAGSSSTTEKHSKVCTVKIADFGLTKTKNASRTGSGQSLNTGSTLWMAPEVINLVSRGHASGEPTRKATFNPRKADVYSFAIVCSEILTSEKPFGAITSIADFMKEVKAVENPIRPDLPNDCPPRLTSLIQRCWAGLYVERPLFPEICNELRYIKGLLLRNDQKLLNVHDVLLGFDSNVKRVQRQQEPGGHNNGDEEDIISHVTASMECIKRQGPWGRNFFGKKLDGLFSNVAKSIKWINLKYNPAPSSGVGFMQVGYVELDGTEFVGRYGDNIVGSMVSKMKFERGEFIQQVSGSVAPHGVSLPKGKVDLTCIASLTIHTNCRKCGPFGAEVGQPFTSGSGKVVGFHGAAGALLDVLGVWIIPDGQEDADQSFLKE